ncbi:hypothetical protein HZS_6740 [Henneguya salminicola]|nr:hypothetical protein HZS_6740 [Henneguya salminicola]
MIVSAPPGKNLFYFLTFSNQGAVLLLTFLAYASLHACRKALPVVKNRLQGNCSSSNEVCYNGFDPFGLNVKINIR